MCACVLVVANNKAYHTIKKCFYSKKNSDHHNGRNTLHTMNRLVSQRYVFPTTRPEVIYDPSVDFINDGMMMLLERHIHRTTKCVLEVGPCTGLSTRYSLSLPNTPHLKMVCVDLWKQPAPQRAHTQKNVTDSSHASFRSSASASSNQSRKRSTTRPSTRTPAHLLNTFVTNVWEHQERVCALRMGANEAVALMLKNKVTPEVCYVHTHTNDKEAMHSLRTVRQAFPSAVVIGNGIIYNPKIAMRMNQLIHLTSTPRVEMITNGFALLPAVHCKAHKLPSVTYQTIAKPVEPTIQTPFALAVIVAFHSKFHTKARLQAFVRHMHTFLHHADKHISYKIFVVSQNETYVPLNRGYLHNVGYHLAKHEGYNRFVFHDMHMIPRSCMLPYYTHDNKEKGVVYLGHSCASQLLYTDFFTFGAIMFTQKQFEALNGYPIDNYGYCGWDYGMWQRLQNSRQKLLVPPAQHRAFYRQPIKQPKHEEWERMQASLLTTDDMEKKDHWKTNGLGNSKCILKRVKNHTKKHSEQVVADEYCVDVVDYRYFPPITSK